MPMVQSGMMEVTVLVGLVSLSEGVYSCYCPWSRMRRWKKAAT